MSYVDAFHNRKTDTVYVVERDKNGNRVYQEFDAEYTLYHESPTGTHKSLFGDACRKFTTNSNKKFLAKKGELSSKGKKIFESDINPIFRAFEAHYRGLDAPVLNTLFFDIEVDFDPDKGFAPPEDPFNKVTAITTYNKRTKKLVTLGLCPPTLTMDQAEALCEEYENTTIYDSEKDLLEAFLDLIDATVDVMSGWNSLGFDVPYCVNRIERVLGKKATTRMCLWGQFPRKRIMEKFKKEYETYDLVGIVHLDYLDLYKKHTPQQLHTYRLDYVGEIEVGENKVPYDGSLDKLYKEDFKKFIAYSRQDVALLNKIDDKKKFIELANQVAHANCILLKTTMGTVALVEQAITLEMHDLGLVAPDRKESNRDIEDGEDEEQLPVVGAYVALRKGAEGLHEHIGSKDAKSLYPSVIRSLCASKENIIGQMRPDATDNLIAKRLEKLPPNKRAEAWEGLFHTLEYGFMQDKTNDVVIIDFEDGRSVEKTGAEWYEWIFDPKNRVCISANGTLFRTDQEGIIPLVLTKWYADRKVLQKEEEVMTQILNDQFELSDELSSSLNTLMN